MLRGYRLVSGWSGDSTFNSCVTGAIAVNVTLPYAAFTVFLGTGGKCFLYYTQQSTDYILLILLTSFL